MKITITVGNTHAEYDTGTVLLKVAEDFQTDYRYPIVLGKVDGKLTELFRTLNADAEVEFLTTGDHQKYEYAVRRRMLQGGNGR